jgi:AcrR family transcriptional regulator
VKTASPVKVRPRTKPPEIRRAELMDAAERLFIDNGIAATSVDAIVAAADVAKGTFYIHFQSKEQLLVALRQRFVEHFRGDLEKAVDCRGPDDWKGKLRAWVEAGIAAYLDRLSVHDVVFHEFRVDNRRPTHENLAADHLADLLGRGAQARAWSVEDTRLTAIMLFHALHAAVDDAIAARQDIDRKRLARHLRKFFSRAVGLA